MPEFISNELIGLFSLSIKRYFRWNLLKSNYFFLVQKCKNANVYYLVALPYPQNACMHCMPMLTHCMAKRRRISF